MDPVDAGFGARQILMRTSAAQAVRVAVLHRLLGLPRDQRRLRAHRVVGRSDRRGSAAAFLGTQGDVWDTQWDT